MSKVISIDKGKRPTGAPQGERIFHVSATEHREVEYEVWAHSKEEALENLRKGQGFLVNVEASTRDIHSVDEGS